MFENKRCVVLILIFFVFHWKCRCEVAGDGGFSELSRKKRTLLWPKGISHLRVITGVGVPVDLEQETVIIGSIIRGIYNLPTNTSELSPFNSVYYERRKKRSLSRWDIYDLLAQAGELRGFGGKSCILRTICELSHRPVDKNYGLFDELIHVLFNPSSTKETLRHHTDNEYYAAQKIGKKSGDSCQFQFSDCKINLVDMFTI